MATATAWREGLAKDDGNFVRRHMVSVVRNEVDPRSFALLARLEVFRRVERHWDWRE
jgi:hypothetical protein